MMKQIQAAILALSLIPCATPFAVDGDAVLGGAIGGGIGAAIGSEAGGREGAIVGSGVGAAVGTAIATDDENDSSRNNRTTKQKRYERHGYHDVEYERPRYRARPKIPSGHMPPPGQCRIWYPGRSPGHQPPPGDCQALRHRAPAGTWLIRG